MQHKQQRFSSLKLQGTPSPLRQNYMQRFQLRNIFQHSVSPNYRTIIARQTPIIKTYDYQNKSNQSYDILQRRNPNRQRYTQGIKNAIILSQNASQKSLITDDIPNTLKAHYSTINLDFNLILNIVSKLPQQLPQTSLPLVNLQKPNGYEQKKTLVLDLDETLVHCLGLQYKGQCDVKLPVMFSSGFSSIASVNIRPKVSQFLQKVSPHFEIIIFTASHPCYANSVIDYIDRNKNLVHHRLYRQHCIKISKNQIKDLRILAGRRLEDIIIVDNSIVSFGYQLDNGIPIVPWHSDQQDNELEFLADLVLHMRQVQDVRTVIQNIFGLSKKLKNVKLVNYSSQSTWAFFPNSIPLWRFSWSLQNTSI